MGALFQNAIARVGRTFAAFTPGQKVVSILALTAIIVGGIFLSSWAGKPTYAPLFTNLSAEDAGAIVEDLNAAGVPNELTDGGGTISVPRESVYTERVRLAGQGLPAGDSTSGYTLLDKQGITASEFQQQVGYQRAIEGELKNTIEVIDGVNTAVVHLAIPKKDVFADEEGAATASVLVKTETGKDLDGEQVQAIVNLVSSSVEGLAPDKVTVADAAGRVLSDNGGAGGGGGTGDLRSRETETYEERMSEKVTAALERVVGPGNAVVQVTADLDFDSTTIKSRKFTDPNVKPIAESNSTETYTGAGGGNTAVGVLGPDNLGNTDTTGTTGGAGNDYQKGNEQKTNALDEVNEERQTAPGTVRKLGIGVLLNQKVAGAINPADIQELVVSAANLDTATRGDLVNVTALPFDESAQTKATEELAAIEAEEKKAGLMKMVRIGSLVLVIFVMLVMSLFGGRKRSRAASALRRAELAAVQKRMDQLEMERIRAIEAGSNIAGELESYDPAAERITQVREEIGDLVENQPDEVAALLRSWLADRRA